MRTVIVTDRRQEWFEIPDATVLTARRYLTEPDSGREASVRVLNLCRTDRYQGRGYYVSLLAEARGHRPLPEVKTLGDLQSSEPPDRLLPATFGEQLQRALSAHCDATFALDAYFGRDPAKQNDGLAQQLFAALRIPLLRAHFRHTGDRWQLRDLSILAVTDIEPAQRP